MANLYFADNLPSEKFAAGAVIEVTGEEARHAIKVARLRVGEEIAIGNGAGQIAAGVVRAATQHSFSVELMSVTAQPAASQQITLVQALAKGDRAERAVQQATELGVDEILPWQSERSVSRWSGSEDKTQKGVAKWTKIAREAAKQSLRAWVPRVGHPVTLSDLAELARDSSSEVVVLHPRGKRKLSEWAGEPAAASTQKIVLIVGPEGGLSDNEIAVLETAGAQTLVLGNTVLRTSSAGPAALAVINTVRDRW